MENTGTKEKILIIILIFIFIFSLARFIKPLVFNERLDTTDVFDLGNGEIVIVSVHKQTETQEWERIIGRVNNTE